VLQLRIAVPVERASVVLHELERLDIVHEVAHLPGCARKPAGDLVLCTVPREAVSALIDALRALGVDERGSVVVTPVVATVSASADAASEQAGGLSSDAVVWEQVEGQMKSAAELSTSYLAFIAVAGILAAIALLTDSVVLIIGAMVVGPEFGPLSALSVGVVRRQWGLARRGAATLLLGFAFAIVMAYLATRLFMVAGMAPATWSGAGHPFTAFVARPDGFAPVVAGLAGFVGMLSLTTSQSGVLIGVFISVTTIPAAGNIAVAAAYGHGPELRGSAAQLGINLGIMIVVGLVTLAVQRHRYAGRLDDVLARLTRRLGGRRSSG
jgi:uncharacterized hydrophobic protein (TIGR00271 family)